MIKDWPQPEDLIDAKVGEPFAIPAGTRIISNGPKGFGVPAISKRKQTIRPRFVDRYPWGKVVVTWAGTGGYWRRVEAGPEGWPE